MLIGLTYLAYVLGEYARIPFDILGGIAHRTYMLSFPVEAPKDIAWTVVSAPRIKLSGFPPIDIATHPDVARPGVFTGFITIGDRRMAFAYRVLEMRDGEAMSLQIIDGESDPMFYYANDYTAAVAVTGNADAARVTTTHHLTHEQFKTRLTMPLMQITSAMRIRRTANERAGRNVTTSVDQLQSALITGALTFASFFALFGSSVAAVLIAVILVHEIGHVIAMRWAGIRVRGIYFVPFFGGVAVADGLARTEVQRGLIALMGPGLSVMTTFLLLVLGQHSGSETMRLLATTSAWLNAFNLLPIFPLDGGHVMASLLSRAGRETLRAFQVVTLFAGIVLAGWIGDYLLMALLGLIGPSLLRRPDPSSVPLPVLSRGETMWMAAAYAATIIFYASVIWRLSLVSGS